MLTSSPHVRQEQEDCHWCSLPRKAEGLRPLKVSVEAQRLGYSLDVGLVCGRPIAVYKCLHCRLCWNQGPRSKKDRRIEALPSISQPCAKDGSLSKIQGLWYCCSQSSTGRQGLSALDSPSLDMLLRCYQLPGYHQGLHKTPSTVILYLPYHRKWLKGRKTPFKVEHCWKHICWTQSADPD